MSMKDRLAKKTQDLSVPVRGEGSSIGSPMRTGPGQMLMVNSLMRESNEKLALLEERLRKFDGGFPVLLLNTDQIVVSKWANRVSASFDTAAFSLLKTEIANAGGNVQPIKVRPLGEQDNRFEIVFGHRRYQACVELGLPVLALVEEMTDADLFKQMDRENRARADLSPWEQGNMYRQALDDKLFGSREHLARELGIDPGNLSKALRLAGLDKIVVAAFNSPLDLQYRWAKPLSDAFIHDKERMLLVLRELSGDHGQRHSAKYVFDRLVAAPASLVQVEEVKIGKQVVAVIHAEGGQVTVKFGDGFADEMAIGRLRDFIVSEMCGS